MTVEELSVFFPAYNEEANIESTVANAITVLKKVAKKWEIIVIDDGSIDRTGEIIKALIKKEPQLRLITHTPNRGYGAALKSGLYHSRYNLITFMDADGQFDFGEITGFLETQRKTGADLVIGYYRQRQVPFYRILGSKLLWQPAVWLLFGLKVKDIDCGFKLLKKEIIEKIPKLEAERGPFISSELLIKAKQAGFKIREIGVSHFPRKSGKATGASLKVILSGFLDLIRLKRKLNRI
ncbi:MAG: glycosyltransferase family 2 protein [Candidatus Marinimicrobia bacterium]|nr:glycosyltransferase family 2 protein [Candidatus Neomarinimicrobiota bacterium]